MCDVHVCWRRLHQMAPAHITCVVLDARQHRIVVGDERGSIGCYYFETGVLQKSWSSDKPAAITSLIYGGEVGTYHTAMVEECVS